MFYAYGTYISGVKRGLKGCFWGVFFALFWGFSKKTLGNIFLYGLCICCVLYIEYMFSLNESQLLLLGWTITIGSSLIVIGLTLLLSYCLYSLYKVVKDFSKK